MATKVQIEGFIAKIGPLIKEEAKKRGYKVASPIIAQACLESGYGLSSLSAKYHNYFGMKCGSSWKGKSVNLATREEYTPGVITNIRDNFRVYDSMKDGVKGYFDFISYSRYANLKSASTAEQYLTLIKQDGYATSSTYVSSNMQVVKSYNLTRFDDFTPNVSVINNPVKKDTTTTTTIPTKRKSNKEIAKEVLEGKWGNGDERKNKLTKAGYNYNAIQKIVNKLAKKR